MFQEAGSSRTAFSEILSPRTFILGEFTRDLFLGIFVLGEVTKASRYSEASNSHPTSTRSGDEMEYSESVKFHVVRDLYHSICESSAILCRTVYVQPNRPTLAPRGYDLENQPDHNECQSEVWRFHDFATPKGSY
jgi:hypothetical protein